MITEEISEKVKVVKAKKIAGELLDEHDMLVLLLEHIIQEDGHGTTKKE